MKIDERKVSEIFWRKLVLACLFVACYWLGWLSEDRLVNVKVSIMVDVPLLYDNFSRVAVSN